MAPKTKFNFKGRPDRACSTDELRPAMNFIFIQDQCMIATDGIMLVKIPLELSEIQGDKLLLEGCYIHKNQYMELLRYDTLLIKGKGEIEAIKHSNSARFSVFFKLQTNPDFRFPEWKNVIGFESEAIPKLGINQRKITQMISCFEGLGSTGNWRMEFQKKGRGIHFHSEENEGLFGLLMPVMLKD